jgi:hypothetical protein
MLSPCRGNISNSVCSFAFSIGFSLKENPTKTVDQIQTAYCGSQFHYIALSVLENPGVREHRNPAVEIHDFVF